MDWLGVAAGGALLQIVINTGFRGYMIRGQPALLAAPRNEYQNMMIVLDAVTKEYKSGIGATKVRALDELTLMIPKGEVFGFLGPNGAGKSTAIKILMNLVYPDTGSAAINGKDVGDAKARQFVGYLPENPYFYDYLTAEELLWFGGTASGLHRREIADRTERILSRVDLQHAKKRQLRTYSKGMVQRAGLALALIHDPQVVILDEPMSGLDPIGRKMVGDLMVELKAEGKTVFFSSHVLSDIERFCDRVGIIVNGRLRVADRVDRLLSGGVTLEQLFLNEVKAAGGGREA